MKKLFFVLTTVMMIASSLGAQEAVEESKAPAREPAGISIGVDYYSHYLWRGTRFFGSDGAFIPALSWDVMGSGLTLGMSMELSASYFFEGFQHKPKKYYYTDAGIPYKKQLKLIREGYLNHSLDFGADYSHTFSDAVTLGISVWYYWYFNHPRARELALPVYTEANTGYMLRSRPVDLSFQSTMLTLGIDAVPFINPVISFAHDWYTAEKLAGDFYVQFAIGHDFEMTKEVTVGIGTAAGYYYYRTGEKTRFYISYDAATQTFSPERDRSPLIKGVSDITTRIELAFTKGPISLNGGFYWVAVPAKSWYKGDTVHRYYAKVGVSCSI